MHIDSSRYLGLAEEEATQEARADGYAVVRIVARDGRYPAVTRDYREDRMNFAIRDGKVWSARRG